MPNSVGLLKVLQDTVDSTGKTAGQVLVPDGSGGWTSEDHYTKTEAAALNQVLHSSHTTGSTSLTTSYVNMEAIALTGLASGDKIYILFSALLEATREADGAGLKAAPADYALYFDTTLLQEMLSVAMVRHTVGAAELLGISVGASLFYVDTGRTGGITYYLKAKRDSNADNGYISKRTMIAIVDKA